MSTTSEPLRVDVDAVAAAVTACPSVARLHGGGLAGSVATYLPGRRVEGVRVGDDAVEIHIATRWDVPMPQAAAEVRVAVAPLVGARPITVVVDDIDDPQAAIPATTGTGVVDPPAVPTARPMGGPATSSTEATGHGSPPDAVPSPS